MTVQFSNTALKALKKIDKNTARKIIEYSHELEKLKDPRARGKGLKSNLAGLWRYRIGDYRMICEIRDEVLTIMVLKIGHRRDVY